MDELIDAEQKIAEQNKKMKTYGRKDLPSSSSGSSQQKTKAEQV